MITVRVSLFSFSQECYYDVVHLVFSFSALPPMRYYVHDCLFACLSVCFSAELCKYYWFKLQERNQRLGLVLT